MSFNGSRLRIGRLFKEWSQRELADRVAVSHPLIAAYEKGHSEPKGDILAALAAVLNVEPEFFFDHGEDEFREEETNFRKRITAPDRLKKKILAQASLFGMVVHRLNTHVEFPALDVPEHQSRPHLDIENVAAECRRHWGLGVDAPIDSMTRTVEHAGIVILTVDCDTAMKVDAFSRFGTFSVVVLNYEKQSPSRTVFDIAHELGHGVLHRRARHIPLDRREDEANRFASAFLLPKDAFTHDFFEEGRTDWAYLLELKRRWNVSLQAIIYRAYQLNLIDAAEYRTRFRYITRQGWRTNEPNEPELDEPVLFRMALDQYTADTGQGAAEIARDLHWTPQFFTDVTGIEVPTAVDPTVIQFDDFRQRRAATG